MFDAQEISNFDGPALVVDSSSSLSKLFLNSFVGDINPGRLYLGTVYAVSCRFDLLAQSLGRLHGELGSAAVDQHKQ